MTERVRKLANEFISRRVYMQRYINLQARKALEVMRECNNDIVDYFKKHKGLETKKLYNEAQKFLKDRIKQFKIDLKEHYEKELRKFIPSQASFLNDTIALLKEGAEQEYDPEKILQDIEFDAFSDYDTIDSFIENTGNRIFTLWDSQCRIIHYTKQSTDVMIEAIMGKVA